MKFSFVAATGLGLGLVLASALAVGQDAPKGTAPAASGLGDLKSKASYGLGLSLGKNLKAQSVDIDPELLARGLKDGLTGAKPMLTDEQIQAVMQEFQQQLVAKRMEASKVAAEKNLKDGEAFLAANKAKPGVVTLPSGLQYKVVKEGTGKTPKATDTVSTHYTGTLLDGTKFDSSVDRGQPASFPVNGVIKGWTEALQLMKVGAKWQLFIPSGLAYGPNPPPGSPIGPNSVLVFDIELLGVE
ncbi:MAG: FKBP-type peptidyl-prolyl cis-trans isomerase [Isosphaeraceae bacterium]